MVEKIIVNPNEVRGLGDIVSPKSDTDFIEYASSVTEGTDTVYGATEKVFSLEDTFVFSDGGVTGNSKLSYWYWNTNRGTGSVSDDGTTFTATSTSNFIIASATLTSPATSSIYVFNFPMAVEFDIVSYEDPTSDYSRVRVYNDANSNNGYWYLQDYGVGHYKIVCEEGSQKLYYNDVLQDRSFTFTPTTQWNIAFQTKGNIKYKNFVVYNI